MNSPFCFPAPWRCWLPGRNSQAPAGIGRARLCLKQECANAAKLNHPIGTATPKPAEL